MKALLCQRKKKVQKMLDNQVVNGDETDLCENKEAVIKTQATKDFLRFIN